jgi:hypothetical protein
MNSQQRIHRDRAVSGLLFGVLVGSLSSCWREPPAFSIGGVEYSETELLTFNANRRTRLAELTAFGLALARGEAEALGDPLIRRQGQEALLDILEREVALELAGVDEADLEAHYRANPRHELSVRHLVLLVENWSTEEEEADARRKAEEALARIQAGEPFAEVAGEVSEEPGAAERGGLLQPGRMDSWVEEFWSAASSLEVGSVSPVIRTQYGFHVLKLEGREPVPFPEARPSVVEEVSALLPSNDAGIQSWVDSVNATVTVDSLALAGALEEAGSLFGLTRHPLLAGGQGTSVASWPAGSLTGEELRSFLISLERTAWEHVAEGGVTELQRVTSEAARRALLCEIAGSRGIALSPRTSERHRREWVETAMAWAGSLGFVEGMNPDALKNAAMNAATSSGQGARIAREALQGWGPLLLSAYPVGP